MSWSVTNLFFQGKIIKCNKVIRCSRDTGYNLGSAFIASYFRSLIVKSLISMLACSLVGFQLTSCISFTVLIHPKNLSFQNLATCLQRSIISKIHLNTKLLLGPKVRLCVNVRAKNIMKIRRTGRYSIGRYVLHNNCSLKTSRNIVGKWYPWPTLMIAK